jgi:kynurenine formamidase
MRERTPETAHLDAPWHFASTMVIWEGHKARREIGYCHIEKLHNLESLPAKGFVVSCFPVKVRRGSAGWTRAVAILDSAT